MRDSTTMVDPKAILKNAPVFASFAVKDLDPARQFINKSLAREPEERYVSAGALGEDLGKYIEGDPVEVRSSAGTVYYLRKRVKKYRGRIAMAAAVVALLIASGVWSYLNVTRERNAALAANAEKDRQTIECNIRGPKQRRTKSSPTTSASSTGQRTASRSK